MWPSDRKTNFKSSTMSKPCHVKGKKWRKGSLMYSATSRMCRLIGAASHKQGWRKTETAAKVAIKCLLSIHFYYI